MTRLRAFLLALLKWPLALVILFEEWGWEPLQRLLARIGQWPGFRWIEGRVRALPPYAALALFALPALLLLPVKLAALWLIHQGRTMLGLAIIVIAKIVGTAIVARLFTLSQPALMQLGWFARLYTRWSSWKQTLLAWVRASSAWRAARALKASLRRQWSRWVRG
ncbi:MAG: hypothetical protein IPJ08_23650 [Burkholderiales bacterium]|nr:hypothetical protein [Burkholderiales bacterium]